MSIKYCERYWFLTGLLFFISTISFSQTSYNYTQSNFAEFQTIVTSEGLLYMPIYKNCDCEVVNQVEESEEEDFIASLSDEFWDNTTFNPFEEEVQYPFLLTFDTDSFAAPVDRKMIVTSRYGWRRGRPHRGIDIDLVTGDDVKSILGGKVRFVGYHSGHGKTVIVRHFNGLETVYAHLSSFEVEVNQEVKKGEVIGKGGVTGNARGSHLHLEVRYMGNTINPEYLFDFTEDTKVNANTIYVTEKWTSPRYHRSTRQTTIEVCQTLEEAEQFKPEKNEVYIVKKGDTLHRIANKYGVKVAQLCKKNALTYNSKLKIGQRLIVF